MRGLIVVLVMISTLNVNANSIEVDCDNYVNYSDVDETLVSQGEHDEYREAFLTECVE